MTYLPPLGSGGYLGWMTLQRTSATQREVHAKQPQMQREEQYFRENIAKVKTAEDLVKDRRLLSVALGAFGLQDDINNRFFIKKVLEEGFTDPKALANRLQDKRYLELAKAFSFGGTAAPLNTVSGFADKIIPQWKDRRFEAAVGQVDGTLRLAMNAQREVALLAQKDLSDSAGWYTIMGQRPLRQVFETVFNLPTAFALLDVEKQRDTLMQKAAATFGDSSVAQFSDPEKLDKLLRSYLLKSEMQQNQTTLAGGSVALTLLTQAAARR